MASSSSPSVTLDRAYFETLLRKAQNASGKDHSTPLNLSMVTIPKADYDAYRKQSREYGNLCQALYRGGITAETLDVLITQEVGEPSGDNSTVKHPSPQKSSEAGTLTTSTEEFYSQGLRTDSTSSYINTPRMTNASMSFDTDSSTNGYRGNNKSDYQHTDNYYEDYGYAQHQANAYYDPGNGQNHGFNGNGNAYVEEFEQQRKLKKNCRRTVNIGNLDKATTHEDVTAVVVGGPLLAITLRVHDRIASVSFVDEEDANSFYKYAKKNDIYIRGRRVPVFWAERHFTLPNHVANKINIGATRNLIVYSASSRHTEASIRDDLEHIHNCVVISVKFVGGNAKIETNAVHNAMFARTCMMSRAKYKGSRIDWDVDECAVPCPEKKIPLQPSQKANVKDEVPTNRFAVLDTDAGYETETGLRKGKMIVTAKTLEIV